MPKRPAYDDICEFSRCTNADEERLLRLYRAAPWEERTTFLYRSSRIRFGPFFSTDYNSMRDTENPTALHEDLETALRSICPREHFGEIDIILEPPYFKSLFSSAWVDIAPVILGAADQDGQRADELYRAVVDHCYAIWQRPVTFQRKDALELIEDWREAALQTLFLFQE